MQQNAYKASKLHCSVSAAIVGLLTGTYTLSRRISRQQRNKAARLNPNRPCPCRSGKKFKRCCGLEDRIEGAIEAARKGRAAIRAERAAILAEIEAEHA